MQPRNNRKRIYIIVAAILVVATIVFVLLGLRRGSEDTSSSLETYSGPGYQILVPESYAPQVIENKDGRVVFSPVNSRTDGFIEVRSNLDASRSITEERARQIATELGQDSFIEKDDYSLLFTRTPGEGDKEVFEWLYFYPFQRASVTIQTTTNTDLADLYREVGDSFRLLNPAPTE